VGTDNMNVPALDNAAFQRRGFDRQNLGRVVNGNFASHRMMITGNKSAWNMLLSRRFDQMCALEQGWDGYTGRPVNSSCANFAATVLEHLYREGLEAPSLVPGGDGTVQIEWHHNQFDIELDVLAPNKVRAYRYDCLSNEEQEIHVQNDFSVVNGWLNEMKFSRQNLGVAE
jgi:hypothetical protein